MIEWLAGTGLAVAALLALVLISRRAVARQFGPRAAYALWALPALRVAIPPFTLPADWMSIFGMPQDTTVMGQMTLRRDDQTFGIAPDMAAVPAFDLLDFVVPVLLILWILGICVGLVRFWIVERRQSRRLQAETVLARGTLLQEIDKARHIAGLSHRPAVRIGSDPTGPFVTGLIEPIIILPKDFEQRFTQHQRCLALVHEMTHLRRGDLWMAAAMHVFRTLNWPNPLIHWAWPRFRADQEAACDASVLKRVGETERAPYAETLLTAATHVGRASPTIGTGLALSLHHPVKERLMTLGSDKNPVGKTRWTLAAMLLAATALTAPLSLAEDPTSPPDAPNVENKMTASHTTRYVVTADDGSNVSGFEIRNKDGRKTYFRIGLDGTTEEMTREALEAEFGDVFRDKLRSSQSVSIDRLDGEPGLEALLDPENGFDKIRTIVLNQQGGPIDLKQLLADGENFVADGRASDLQEFRMKFVTSDDGKTSWVGDRLEEAKILQFINAGEPATFDRAEARLRSAEAILQSTNRILGDVNDTLDETARRDLADAVLQLEKARDALAKARASAQDSGDR